VRKGEDETIFPQPHGLAAYDRRKRRTTAEREREREQEKEKGGGNPKHAVETFATPQGERKAERRPPSTCREKGEGQRRTTYRA
jgi:hypothetical protein